MNPRTINGIAKSRERIRCLNFNSFKIQDSISHVASRLRTLTENLKNSDHDFPILKQSMYSKTYDEESNQFIDDPEKVEIATQKCYFPYRFATSIWKCKKAKALPPRSEFVDLLGGNVEITESEYLFAQNAWLKFEVENLFEYMQIYCMIDVVG